MSDAMTQARDILRRLFPHGSPMAQNDLALKLADVLTETRTKALSEKEAEIARLREALIGIRDYPKEGQPRRTSDGYPSEMAYDEWAYRRIIDSYRAVARAALKAEGGEI